MSSLPLLGFFSTFTTTSPPQPSLKPPSSSPFTVSLKKKKVTSVVTYATASEPVTEKKRAPRGFSKPRPVSPEMKEFLGGRTEIPRTEVLKVIWAHIKENNLQ
ncbi:TRI1-like protein, partial [Tanacetum coccineum]